MDANGTRFHLLLGEDDWGSCAVERPGRVPQPLAAAWAAAQAGGPAPDLVWDEGRQELTLRANLFQFGAASPTQLGRALRRGAGRDRYGSWYWIDDGEQAILVRSAGTGNVSPFWSVGDPVGDEVRDEAGERSGGFRPATTPAPPRRLRGLAVTAGHYLVAGVLDPAGLLIFDLHAGGPPRQVVWPAGVPFAPFDMAPAPGGGLWVLDREEQADPGQPVVARYWALDRHFNVIRQDQAPVTLEPERRLDFHPLDGPDLPPFSARTFPGGITLGAAVPVGARDPVAIDGLDDGAVLILDNGGDGEPDGPFSLIWHYRFGQVTTPPLRTRALLDLVDEEALGGFWLLGHDMAVLSPPAEAPAGELACVLVVAPDGNQTYAFALVRDGATLRLRPEPDYLPMRLFGGKGLVAAGDRAYYDSRNDWLPLLEQRRPRYVPGAVLVTPSGEGVDGGSEPRPAFDGREPDCVWHRLLLDGCFPPDTGLRVWSRAANDVRDLAGLGWQPEPAPYRRGSGSELPFTRRPAGQDEGTWELLLQRARGRFLQVRLELRGNGRSAPRLRALRIYYPRFSYLDRYLPAVYRDDPESAVFLDGFLANLEGFYTAIEDRIADVQLLFDWRSAPPEYLDWLASWFGTVLDPGWEESRRRLFLAHAPQLFGERGTLPGLIRAIRLATDPHPDAAIFSGEADTQMLAAGGGPFAVRIVERFRTRLAPGVVFGDPGATEGPGLTTEVSTWTPAQGAEPLHRRYRGWLRDRYRTLADLNAAWGTAYRGFEAILLPATLPPGAARADDWRRFLRAGLGFTYAPVEGADAGAYRAFLARRYGFVGALNRAYGSAYAGFEQVPLPDALPTGGTALYDWIQFVSIAAPTARNAHQFTVLVPSLGDAAPGRETVADRVRRVVEVEKPAHATFDVREYWALFRLGEARLGFDSLVDRGSRLAPLTLGASALAGGYLEYGHPWSVTDRSVTGRDRLGAEREA